MNRIDEIKRMMTGPNPPTLQQYANAVLDLLSEVRRLEARESYLVAELNVCSKFIPSGDK